MNINQVITDIESYLGRTHENSQFYELIKILLSYYRKLNKKISIYDFVLDKGDHRLEFRRPKELKQIVFIDVTSETIEVRFEKEYTFFLQDKSALFNISNFLDSFFSGNYTIQVQKNKEGVIVETKINWNNPSLEYLNDKSNKKKCFLRRPKKIDILQYDGESFIN